ncbi:SDR family NAD(P)-dependent oxidoreductase [Bordetella bronchialis]|uniref:Ketoreductase domain-containing protein n=1 Tax=Bordetella bronchialis TaxID=463025 RepID=A0A193FPF9_9BORD|nr:SDR family oxidoreductase [Bordetella bronchialis]ANN68979.1 hypothetical protein BAU06_24140 [Bordetella bronchialis]ANN74128.1 hypothetical protein BAU08_24710 [Bordetella bronchialis]
MAQREQGHRVVLLTGAGGGIGSAIALALAGQGWRVVLTDRDPAMLDGLRRQCDASMLGAETLRLDVTREQEVADAVRHVVERHGRLDGVVSNAGVPGAVLPIADYPLDMYTRTMAVNATGTFLVLKHGLPALRRGGDGSFVAVASTSSIRGRARLAAYVASKHAVLGLVRSAALETVGSGVRVNAVLPGPTRTAMIDAIDAMAQGRAGPPGAGPPAANARGAIQRAVAAPYGEPADVAQAVAFLLSPASRHMNGAELVVDGGSTLA